jgi:streptogramin lyase
MATELAPTALEEPVDSSFWKTAPRCVPGGRTVIFLSLSMLALAGCGGGANFNSMPAAPEPVAGAAFNGRVHGGQQPISGASVYLYAAGTAGYGDAAVSLLASGTGTTKDGNGNYFVTTTSDGSFSISGDYTCPSATAQVYLYAVGGNAGSSVNSAIGMLAGLGTCTSLSSSTFAYMDEVSTIATAYAMAGYATDATHVSSSGSALAITGVTNAITAVKNLETLNLGTALATTPGTNGTVPQSEIDTLANILAACINSTGSGSTGCTTLLGHAKNGSTTPTDTATAAINIAHNPGANISTLFGLQTGTSPFLPMLSAAPNDFTIAIGYTGGGMLQGVGGLSIDASGDVWVTDISTADFNSGTGGAITKLNPVGAVLSGSGGYTAGGQIKAPDDVEIDASGNAWVANVQSITELSSTGTAISTGTGYPIAPSGTDLAAWNIAIDPLGHVWCTDATNALLIELSSTGSLLSGSGIGGGGLTGPLWLAFDASGNSWISNTNYEAPYGTSISEFSDTGTANSHSPYGGLNEPSGISVSPSGDIWVANFGAGNLIELNSSGSVLFTSTTTAGGLDGPEDAVVDSAGNVFVTNTNGTGISEFNSSGTAISPSTGYEASALTAPYTEALDGSGNLWVQSNGTTGPNVVEYVGIASPVVTPLVANLLTPYGAHTANKP